MKRAERTPPAAAAKATNSPSETRVATGEELGRLDERRSTARRSAWDRAGNEVEGAAGPFTVVEVAAVIPGGTVVATGGTGVAWGDATPMAGQLTIGSGEPAGGGSEGLPDPCDSKRIPTVVFEDA